MEQSTLDRLVCTFICFETLTDSVGENSSFGILGNTLRAFEKCRRVGGAKHDFEIPLKSVEYNLKGLREGHIPDSGGLSY